MIVRFLLDGRMFEGDEESGEAHELSRANDPFSPDPNTDKILDPGAGPQQDVNLAGVRENPSDRIEQLAKITVRGFKGIRRELDFQKRLEKLEQEIRRITTTLHLSK